VAKFRERGALIDHSAEAYQNTVPIGEMLDPGTKALDLEGKYYYFAAQPSWNTKAGAMFR
jgi:N-methylhydantoinase B